MDVTFLESESCFKNQPNPVPIQEEPNHQVWWDNQENINTVHIPEELGNAPENAPGGADRIEDYMVRISEDTDHASGDTDSTPVDGKARPEAEVIQSHEDPDEIPRSISPEDAPEVSSLISERRNPIRTNRNVLPKRYREDGYAISNYTSTEGLSNLVQTFTKELSKIRVPNTVGEALQDSRWVEAMETEMKALETTKTWNLVELPNGKKTVGCKWVFSVKYDATGKVERYKARLVAKGYTQTYGIDFQETFSPVAKLNTVRVLLSFAANFDWPLHQFDVKNAFLHGDLEEEIYMDLPPGYSHQHTKKLVCKLERSLYGLKQSPRAWFGRFCKAMKSYNYNQSDSDHTLFFKHRQGKVTILIIYVDDMIITGDDTMEIKWLEQRLSQEFEMKDLGGLKYFLGIEVLRSNAGISLSQRKYTLDLLAEVGMLDCKPTDTPTIPNLKFEDNPEDPKVNQEAYQKLVGKLIYLSHTRPDIAYAVSMVSQFMHDPRKQHMDAVMRVLRYLKKTPGKGIQFRKNGHLEIWGYTDADWAGDRIDRKSMSGYFTFVGGNLVTWRSKKQNVVALSSAEAEFRGMSKGLCELLWLRKLMNELKCGPKEEMQLHCDNKSAIEIAHNPVQHDRTKHIEIDRHFIKQNLEEKIISFPFVRSEQQLADMLTKAVSTKLFEESIAKLGMVDVYLPT